MDLFWRHGYEGTSIAALSDAMGINTPSLYAAFGNKEALFRKVVERYDEKYGSQVRAALAAPKARDAFQLLLQAAVVQGTRARHPDGCLFVQGALASGPDADVARRILTQRRRAIEAAVRERFERAAREGDLPSELNPRELARFVFTVNMGLCVQAAGGASRAELGTVAATALRCWP